MAAEGAPYFPENFDETPEKGNEKDKDKDKEKDQKKRRGHLVVAHEAKPADEEKPDKAEKAREEKPEKEEPASPLAEAEPVSEEQAPLEELADEEQAAIIQETARQHLEELPSIDDQAPPEDLAAELAAQDFLAEAAEHGDLDAALEATAARLEADPSEITELEVDSGAEEINEEKADTEEAPEVEEELVFDRRAAESAAEIPAKEESDEPDAASPPIAPPASPPLRGAPPAGPFGGFTPPPQGPGRSGGNFASTPAAKPNHEQIEDTASPAAMALAGGIIGYLIGRRRGRIKTEKKLLPIQKKLEKQVTGLQFELQQKEKQIRKVAREKVQQQGPVVIEKLKEEPAKAERLERRKAPEATLLHIPEAPEHIGQVIVTAESKPALAAKAEKIPENHNAPQPDWRVETLNRHELMEISEKINVEGSTLRQIYETHLIGEKGLRRLVAEHLRGGDLKKALQREIVEREIDFERDPVMRDMAPAGSSGTGGGGHATLDQMVKRAAKEVGDNSEEAAYYKARAAYDAQQYSKDRKQQRVIDVSLTIVILSLLSVVLWLVFTRS